MKSFDVQTICEFYICVVQSVWLSLLIVVYQLVVVYSLFWSQSNMFNNQTTDTKLLPFDTLLTILTNMLNPPALGVFETSVSCDTYWIFFFLYVSSLFVYKVSKQLLWPYVDKLHSILGYATCTNMHETMSLYAGK